MEQLQALNPIDAAKRAATAVGAEGVFKTVTLAAGIFGQGVSAVLFFASILLITPLAAFYFIRDRKIIGGELTDTLPPRIRHRSLQVFSDLDSVLGEFMHGQITVMAVMAIIYTLILKTGRFAVCFNHWYYQRRFGFYPLCRIFNWPAVGDRCRIGAI